MTFPRMSDGILYQDAVMQLFGAGDLFVERWTMRGDPGRMRILVEQHTSFVTRRAPAKTLFLVHLAEDSIQLPDRSIRDLIQEHTAAIDPHTQATALVYGASGFGASIFRASLSAAALARRGKYPYQVFGELDPAIDWLASQRSTPCTELRDAAAIRAWYERLEKQTDGAP